MPEEISLRRKRTGIFSCSPLDSLLVLISLLHGAFIFYVAIRFDEFSLPELLALGVFNVFLTCTNYQCVSHNFIHNPFFANKILNRCFGLFNSLGMGAPSSYNHIEHFIHHKYSNDMKDENGKTKDNISIFRFGKGKNPEPFWRYALLTPIRCALTTDYSRKKREIRQEWVVLTLLWVALALINPYALLWYLVFTSFLGVSAAVAENYGEHLNGIPGDPLRDSVSVYNRFYNFIWFGNGYHQEHHLRPSVHWSEIHKIKALLPPENDRFCVRFCHFTNLWCHVDYEKIVMQDNSAPKTAPVAVV